jgi:hypothetical protein
MARARPRDRASAGERARTRAARLRRALCACAALGAACAVAAAGVERGQRVLNARLSEAARRATPEAGLARGRIRAVSEARFASTRGAKRGRWRTRARDDAGGDAATRRGATDDADETTEPTRRGATDDADETTERRYDAFMRAVDEYEDVEEAEEEEEDDGEEARRWAAMLGKRRDE